MTPLLRRFLEGEERRVPQALPNECASLLLASQPRTTALPAGMLAKL
jgi:hypothetical protein